MLVRTTGLATIALALMTSSVLADAITYQGTIGMDEVLMEITEPGDGPLIGRLTRLTDGVDIPLHPISVSGARMELAEELSCLLVTCVEADDGAIDPPLGPRLSLQPEGERLIGHWSDGARDLDVRLTKAGTRVYDRHESFDYQSFIWRSYGEPLRLDNSPYDYLKMQVQLEEGPAVDMGLYLAIRMMTDPRTKFAFPRVVPMQGGPDTAIVNGVLETMQWETNMRGFACLSMAYASGGWSSTAGSGIGTLGHVDEELVSVSYLSPALVSFVQSGSLFCGGSAFYNHIDYTVLDLETGDPFDLSRVFSGWVPMRDGLPVDLAKARLAPMQYSWGPDEALTAFLRERIDSGMEGCDTWEEIPDFLDISFDEGDIAVFRIAGLDSQDLPCEGPFFSAPLAELRPLLTSEALEIFPNLAY